MVGQKKSKFYSKAGIQKYRKQTVKNLYSSHWIHIIQTEQTLGWENIRNMKTTFKMFLKLFLRGGVSIMQLNDASQGNVYVIKWHKFVLQGVLMYLNCTNMYPLGFNGLIECRLLNIFEPGVCPFWIMWILLGITRFNHFLHIRIYPL